jgi:uncharacterized protein GlcG (DUF336 family)
VQGKARAAILLEETQSIIQAAQQKAHEIGQPMNIAVVDNGRQLKAFARMEDAWLGSIDIAIDKGLHVGLLPAVNAGPREMAQPGQPLFGINTTNDGRIVIFGGGVLLMRGDDVAGAVGVSGTPDQDHEVAEAGAAAFS